VGGAPPPPNTPIFGLLSDKVTLSCYFLCITDSWTQTKNLTTICVLNMTSARYSYFRQEKIDLAFNKVACRKGRYIMEILAYGEDALTIWVLRNKLEYILQELGDSPNSLKCLTFFRPSFGRRGGENSSQFGEFDFILLTANRIYLGESKWDNSSEKIVHGKLELRDEQLLRHKLFKFYIEEWAFGQYANWQAFANEAGPKLKKWGSRNRSRQQVLS
jgi:hypothetical protein